MSCSLFSYLQTCWYWCLIRTPFTSDRFIDWNYTGRMRTDIDNNQDFPVQFLVLTGILSTLISHSTAVNVTKGANATIPCTYGEGEVRNTFWYVGDCSTQPIVRYFKGNVTSDETRFRLEADKSTLILENVTIADEGTYCCSVNIKHGVLTPHEFRTKLQVFGPTTLPVITQCNDQFHDVVNSSICTLNAPTNLTCQLHHVYPNKSVKLEWNGDGGSSFSIPDSYLDDDGTYTFVDTIRVSKAGIFWCNASFPSEEGQVYAGVQVLISMIRDPARTNHSFIIVCVVIAAAITFVVFLCCIHGCGDIRRCIQFYNTYGRDADEQGPGHEQRTEETEEDPETVSFVEMDNAAGTSAPEGISSGPPALLVFDCFSCLITPRQMTDRSSIGVCGEGPLSDPETVSFVEMDNAAGTSAPEETNHENHHSTDIYRCTTEIPESQLLSLSKELSPNHYTVLCVQLQISFNASQNILVQNGNDYRKALTHVLMAWKDKTGGVCRVLCTALENAEVGGLIPLIHNATCSGL